MEKINIAELLKDCPQGMELDSTAYDNCTLEIIFDGCLYPIQIRTPEGLMNLTKYGSMSPSTHAKCVIFPKGKTTWEGFHRPFKDGDILVSQSGSIFILKGPNENNYHYGCYIAFDFTSKFIKNCTQLCSKKDCRFATESEKQKLFDVIETNGYKWNPKTKTLEKLDFKDGDILAIGDTIYIYNGIKDNLNHGVHVIVDSTGLFAINTFTKRHVSRFATKEETQKLFDAIKANGYRWNSETKTLEELVEPKFKVGDRINYKNDKRIITITAVKNDCYFIQYFNTNKNDYQNESISIKDQDKYELVSNKFKVGDRVRNKNYKDYIYVIHDITDKGYRAKEINADSPFIILFGSQEDNYELVPSKFDITTLKPFDKVLVRDDNECVWKADFYSNYRGDINFCYVCTGDAYRQCIPYNEETAHLVSTDHNCPDKYKTWKDE